MRVPPEIVCVDCGGPCRPLVHPDVELEPGDVVAFRCLDCNDRWDVVLGDEDGAPDR